MAAPNAPSSSRAHVCDLGQVDYAQTAHLQRQLRAAREAGEIEDVLLVLEHEPVITAGYRTEYADIAAAMRSEIPVVATERGGRATYHGPGQIVMYPIFDLRQHGEDVRAFVRTLEQAIIDVLHQFGVSGDRRDEYPGVWVADRKIASIGLRVTRWVSFHGISVNVDCDLAPFELFTPCGIDNVTMTSIARELGGAHCVRFDAVCDALVAAVAEAFDLDVTPIGADSLRGQVAHIVVDNPPHELPHPPTTTRFSVSDLAGAAR